MASSFILKKRVSLLRFVRDQLIGPNSYNGRYGQDNWPIGETMLPEEDFWKCGEVIDTTPGNVYCSGILFPKKDSSLLEATKPEQNDSPKPMEGKSVVVSDETAGDEQTDSGGAVTEETTEDNDSHDVNQRFPQSCGISCCLSPDIINDNDLTIIVSGRYYTKIQDLSSIYVNVEEKDLNNVASILSVSFDNEGNPSFFSSFFRLSDNHLYLSSPSKQLYAVIKKGLDDYNKRKSEEIRKTDLSWREEDKVLYLASYKEYLYQNRYQNKKITKEEREDVKRRIEKVEQVERALSYYLDLLSALDSRGYGFWKSEDFSLPIDLSGISFDLKEKAKVIFKPTEDASKLKDIVSRPFGRISKDDDGGLASLSSWIQITRDTRNADNHALYLKVLLENTSDIMRETPKSLFSIVNESVNARCFFGVKITISSKHLLPYGESQSIQNNDAETEQLNYIYRGIKDYGIGHICSVDWDDTGEVKRIWSEFMPEYDVPDVDPVPQKVERNGNLCVVPRIKDTKYLEFKTLSLLSEESDDSIIDGLLLFASSYKDWIDELNDSDYPEQVEKIRRECLEDYKRIVSNIQLLKQPDNMQCFRLMNTAMFMQLWHSRPENQNKFSSDNRGKRGVSIDYYKSLPSEVAKGKGPAAWRSFQLAFILLNIDGIINNPLDDNWDKRNAYVDLVWFPTGGGKTEAYLGIIAFCILNRRLIASKNGTKGGGTTAIMRYTLRLLATQQFQRATRLILALESIRSWGIYGLGDEPISIGLYVGNDSLPNTESGLIDEAKKWKDDAPSKIPLDKHRCPWCGGELEWEERIVGRKKERNFICKHTFCFRRGLPILLCDDYVYETPPTLLFGTIDKFAMIAHKVAADLDKDSRRLFTYNGLTPDLIIQDELHLLSGPLGSAAGLFECAIDQLCTRTITINGKSVKVRPKIISSTATTRNTELQIRALYGRGVNVFPKNGINYDDSFYAFYKRNPDNPVLFSSKRKYVGIMPTGRTAMYCQLRLASCFLAHRAVFERDNHNQLNNEDFQKAVDYYFTLVSYFNSKKDVGTTDAQFSSEFPKYTRQILKRTIRPEYMLNCYYAYNESFSKQELTGRLGGEEVVNALSDVQEKWNPDNRDVHYMGEDAYSGVTPPDFVLATNMISVGIDVSRFNCMIINSMPRNKAEYIQATSRVARDEPGIVFTLHNPFRARDVSHYEKFREFHEKLYYYVEPISITPFSRKSIERYLPLYLSTIVRHSRQWGLSTDADVSSITPQIIEQIEATVKDYFSQLANECEDLDGQLQDVITTDSVKEIALFAHKALTEWDAKKGSLNAFSSRPRACSLYTAVDAYEDEKSKTCWVVPTSLRIVPVESVLKIKND